MNMMKMQLYVFTQLIDLIEADQVIDCISKLVLFYHMIFFLGSRRPGDRREVERKKEE